jgi:hypothetical protein
LNKKEKTHQRTKWFRQLQRFRCGIEASISMLKRKFGLSRVLAKGSAGTAIWTGLGHLCIQFVATNVTADDF